jgi:hypothetical protein
MFSRWPDFAANPLTAWSATAAIPDLTNRFFPAPL